MLCWDFFLEGTINDSACSVRRTVSGLALRKNARFNRWDIRLTPNRGSRFLISTIFSRTGLASFGRLPQGQKDSSTPLLLAPDTPLPNDLLCLCLLPPPSIKQESESLLPVSIHTAKFELQPIPLPIPDFLPLAFLFNFLDILHRDTPFSLSGVSPISCLLSAHDLVVSSTHQDFIDSLAPLKSLRESQGWSVAIIDGPGSLR